MTAQPISAFPERHSPKNISEQEMYEIAKDAYVYAYPLVLMHAFMQQGTNFAEPTGLVTQAPYNQFSHAKEFPPADYKAVVAIAKDLLPFSTGEVMNIDGGFHIRRL